MIPLPVPGRLIAGAIGVALLVGLAWWVQHTIRTQDREIATLAANNQVQEEALKGATEALDDINRQHAANMAAILAQQKSDKAQDAADAKLKSEVHNVPLPIHADGACPADPAFDLELDRLRQRAAGGGAGTESRAGDGPAAAAASR